MAEDVKQTLEEIIGEGGMLGLDSSEDPADYAEFLSGETLGMESSEWLLADNLLICKMSQLVWSKGKLYSFG